MQTVVKKTKENKILFIEKHIIYAATVLALNHLTLSIVVNINELVEDVLKKADLLLFFTVFGLTVTYLLILFGDREGKKKIAVVLKKYFSKEQILLFVLCFWLCMSIIISLYDGKSIMIKDNIFCLYNSIIVTLIFFPIGRYYFKYELSSVIVFLCRFFVVVFTMLSLFILITAFSVQSYNMGYLFPFGLNENYQLCVNCNPNVTGMYSAVSVLMCLIVLFMSEHKLSRILYGICGGLNFIILLLSNSRGSFIGFSLGVCLIVEVKILNKYAKKNLLLKILIALLLFAITFGILLLLRSTFFSLFDYITKYSEVIGRDTENVERDLNPMYSSGRLDIWKYSIKWLFSTPQNIFFGASPRGVNEAISLISNNEFNTYTHNQFLEIAVAIGIPGVLVYTIWLFLIARHCILLLVNFIGSKLHNLIIPACVIFAIVIINLVEAYLLFNLNFVGIFFMLLCGYVSGEKQKIYKGKNE